MKLVDVTVFDDQTEEEVTLLGDRLSDTTVRYFVLTDRKYERLPLYRFDDTIEECTPECIAGVYDDNTTLEDLGYTYVKSGYYICSQDDDTDGDILYDPTDEDEDEDDPTDEDI
jgi:hypothetical protein